MPQPNRASSDLRVMMTPVLNYALPSFLLPPEHVPPVPPLNCRVQFSRRKV